MHFNLESSKRKGDKPQLKYVAYFTTSKPQCSLCKFRGTINTVNKEVSHAKRKLNLNQEIMDSRIVSSSTITGKNVYNLEGENIGDIKDLMINPKDAKIAYAVLSFGGFLDIGSKYFAIPIEALQFSEQDDTIKLDVKKETLENAPSFDKDNWPMTADNEFIDSVYSHYGYENHGRAVL